MDPKLRKRIKDCADELAYDCLYFGYQEFDDEDIVSIAQQFNIDAKLVCRVLKIAIPKELMNEQKI